MTVPTKKDKPMLKIFLHDQIKILLERMETHPEEFFTPKTLGEGKWDPFMPGSSIFRHFTKLEQYLIRRKYCKMRDKLYRQQAYDGILETLVFKEEPRIKEHYTTSNIPLVGTPFTGGSVSVTAPAHSTTVTGTINANGLTLGSETLDAETIKHMKEHIRAIQKAELLQKMKMGGR
jgi:hypothetical protein